MTRRLKLLARDLHIPVVLLAQLNREVESRQGRRPVLSDLRESGAIEQDADIVMMLWRPEDHDTDANPHQAELIIRKHRHGTTGVIPLYWRPETYTFASAAKPHQGNGRPT